MGWAWNHRIVKLEPQNPNREKTLMRYSNRWEEPALIDCRIDRQSFIPVYQQIKNWLINKIKLGELSDGDVIPSEVQLSAALRVSRAPVRQALYELRIAGYIVREKGRGTFVEMSSASKGPTYPISA
jgi:GntR family transcriptional regulator